MTTWKSWRISYSLNMHCFVQWQSRWIMATPELSKPLCYLFSLLLFICNSFDRILCQNFATFDILPHKNRATAAIQPHDSVTTHFKNKCLFRPFRIPCFWNRRKRRSLVISIRRDLADKLGRSLQEFIGCLKLIQHAGATPTLYLSFHEVKGFWWGSRIGVVAGIPSVKSNVRGGSIECDVAKRWCGVVNKVCG